MNRGDAIYIGEKFSLDFEFSAGAIPAGAGLWLPLWQNGWWKRPGFARVNFERISDTLFRLRLNREQTAQLRPGRIGGNIRLEFNGESALLGMSVSLSVEQVL